MTRVRDKPTYRDRGQSARYLGPDGLAGAKFVRDFVAACHKVMALDRFDLA